MFNQKNETRISVRVTPNSARNEIGGFTDDILRVKVAAPPVKGKANKELIALLSQALGVDKSRATIIHGHTSRSKVIAIDGLSQEEVMKKLSSFSSGGASK